MLQFFTNHRLPCLIYIVLSITFGFLAGSSEALKLLKTMDRSSSSSTTTPMPQQQKQNADEEQPSIIRRYSWSGSRKINVAEEDDIASTSTFAASASSKHIISEANADDTIVKRQNFVSSLIAGVGSGSLASVVCAPLDLVRTRMQVAGGLEGKAAHNAKIIKSIQEIYVSDGIRGCFRGLGATLATVPAFWGLYFPLYEGFKKNILEWSSQYAGSENGGNNHHAFVHLSSAMTAGAIADVVCNPMFVVRTRMQTEALHYFQMTTAERKPHGVMSTVLGLYKEGGVPIFWRGLTASLLGLGHVGIQFPVYERLKAEARKRSSSGEETPLDLLVASGLSKMTAAVITYPHEVIRSRMMDARGPVGGKNALGTLRHIVKKEGYAGLYVGLRVSLIRVVPNCCVTFVSYELIAREVRKQMGGTRRRQLEEES